MTLGNVLLRSANGLGDTLSMNS